MARMTVLARWKDTGAEFEAIVESGAWSGNEDEDEDGDVFWYCDSENPEGDHGGFIILEVLEYHPPLPTDETRSFGNYHGARS
jgi:hypothetical protein